MESNYWASIISRRALSRRRFIKGASATAAGAAALSLIGCGGSGNEGGDATSLISNEQESTKQAKQGGVFQDSYTTEIANMDPVFVTGNTISHIYPVYGNLLSAGLSSSGTKPGDDAITGDMAESWEVAPDATRITLKLRPNQKWDRRAPTNGRTVDMNDVVWSWNKFVAQGPSAPDLSYSRSNGDSPIEAMETPDSRTIVFKLAFPYSAITQLLSNALNYYIQPADESFNFKGDMRGSGAFYLDSVQPGSQLVYKRNPDWHGAPRPFLDGWVKTLVTEYSTGMAQFRAKNLWQYEIRPEDILGMKREMPELTMLPDREVAGGAFLWNFSKRDDSIFKDVRLRRALSMLIERDLIIETENNVEAFRAEGLPIQTYWHGHLAAGLSEWVDPKGTGLGEGAKYFQFNPAEAKKLAEASGLKMPIEFPWAYFSDRAPEEGKLNEIVASMVSEGGVFKPTLEGLAYDTTWRTARASAGSGFAGTLYQRASSLPADLILNQKYTPTGRNSVSKEPLPVVTDLVKKQRTEVDPKRRLTIIQEIQKQLAMDWPDMSVPGVAPSFTLRWPWLRNHGIWQEGFGTGSARQQTYYWYDQSRQA